MKVDKMLREWRVTYQEELAQLRAEEKKVIAKAVAKMKGKAKERAAAKAVVKAAMKAAYKKVELPCVSGIYHRYLEYIPNMILLKGSFYTHGGIKKNSNTYIQVDPVIFAGKDILFQAQDEFILFLILGDMPAELRDPLERSIEICLGGTSEKPVLYDIRSPEEIAKFISIHFQWYARMCQKGTGAPKHVHPWFLKREGVTKTNHTQIVPYESREMLDHYEEYNALCMALERIFTWIEQKLKVYLGDIYDEIT
ncbi:hypothetical protein V8D89_002571 [Ganoderma adspersum]